MVTTKIPVFAVSTRLTELEERIQHGLEMSLDAGAALISIRDEKLYLEIAATFKEYCDKRWSISRAQAYRLIKWAEASANLSPIGDIRPKNESQVRSLAGLTPKLQQQIFRRAVEEAEGKSPTARQVEEAKKTILKQMNNDDKPPEPFVVIEKDPSLDKQIQQAVYEIFEKSQSEMKRLRTKNGQEKFKMALLAVLSEKLIPSKPVTAREAMRNWKQSIARYILENESKREAKQTEQVLRLPSVK